MFEELLKNKFIRSFLQHFSPQHWDRAVKYALIYGIQGLELRYDPSCLGLDDLEALIIQNAAALGVEDVLPELEVRINSLQRELEELQGEMGGSSSPQRAGKTAGRSQPRRRQPGQGKAPRPPPDVVDDIYPDVHPKPSHKWRDGEEGGLPWVSGSISENDEDEEEERAPFYGDFLTLGDDQDASDAADVFDEEAEEEWLRLGHQPPSKRKSRVRGRKRKDHPELPRQPRLAYSTRKPTDAEVHPPYEDDLATAEYLFVPSRLMQPTKASQNRARATARSKSKCKPKSKSKSKFKSQMKTNKTSSSLKKEASTSKSKSKSQTNISRARARSKSSSSELPVWRRPHPNERSRHVPRHLQGVESRVKEQVKRDKVRHRQRCRAKQTAVKDMLQRGGYSENPEFQPRSRTGSNERDPVMEITDSFLKGPFVDYFAAEKLDGDVDVDAKDAGRARPSWQDPIVLGEKLGPGLSFGSNKRGGDENDEEDEDHERRRSPMPTWTSSDAERASASASASMFRPQQGSSKHSLFDDGDDDDHHRRTGGYSGYLGDFGPSHTHTVDEDKREPRYAFSLNAHTDSSISRMYRNDAPFGYDNSGDADGAEWPSDNVVDWQVDGMLERVAERDSFDSLM